jgi:hypothetical protein
MRGYLVGESYFGAARLPGPKAPAKARTTAAALLRRSQTQRNPLGTQAPAIKPDAWHAPTRRLRAGLAAAGNFPSGNGAGNSGAEQGREAG